MITSEGHLTPLQEIAEKGPFKPRLNTAIGRSSKSNNRKNKSDTIDVALQHQSQHQDRQKSFGSARPQRAQFSRATSSVVSNQGLQNS